MNKQKIKQLIKNILEDYGLESSIPIDLNRLASVIGAEIKEGHFEEGLSGFALQKNGVRIIGINKSESPSRRRFTTAHELGHLFLHRDSISYDQSIMMFRNGHSSDGTDEREIDANRFAAELLMPEDAVRTDLRGAGPLDLIGGGDETQKFIKRLAKKYQVSPTAMTYRVTELYFSPVKL